MFKNPLTSSTFTSIICGPLDNVIQYGIVLVAPETLNRALAKFWTTRIYYLTPERRIILLIRVNQRPFQTCGHSLQDIFTD